MTVSNVVFERDRIRLVSDTVAYRDKKPVLLHRKIGIAERASVAFIVRGLSYHGDVLEGSCDIWRNFDEAAFAAEYHFSSCDLGMFSKAKTAEATIVGWKDGAPIVTRLLADVENGAIRVRRVDLDQGVYLAPTLGKHQIPSALTEEQIVKIALLQQSLSIKYNLNMCVGGDIEMATVTADGVTIQKLGEYPDKALTEKRIEKLQGIDLRSVAA